MTGFLLADVIWTFGAETSGSRCTISAMAEHGRYQKVNNKKKKELDLQRQKEFVKEKKAIDDFGLHSATKTTGIARMN